MLHASWGWALVAYHAVGLAIEIVIIIASSPQ
jgi:hypothetical protein